MKFQISFLPEEQSKQNYVESHKAQLAGQF